MLESLFVLTYSGFCTIGQLILPLCTIRQIMVKIFPKLAILLNQGVEASEVLLDNLCFQAWTK